MSTTDFRSLKAGDSLVFIGISNSNFTNGKNYTVISFTYVIEELRYRIQVIDDTGKYVFVENLIEFRKVTETISLKPLIDSYTTEKFKIGDKVRCNTNANKLLEQGQIYTVESLSKYILGAKPGQLGIRIKHFLSESESFSNSTTLYLFDGSYFELVKEDNIPLNEVIVNTGLVDSTEEIEEEISFKIPNQLFIDLAIIAAKKNIKFQDLLNSAVMIGIETFKKKD